MGGEFTLAVAGDLIMTHPMRASLQRTSPELLHWLASADVAFGNCECSILDIDGFAGYPEALSGDGWLLAPGALWIPVTTASRPIVEKAVSSLGISAIAAGARPQGSMFAMRMPRIGLFDQYGGLMPSGWIRFELEQFEFPYDVVYAQGLDAGHLRDKYDVIVFSDGGLSLSGFIGGQNHSASMPLQPEPANIPAEDRPMLGAFTEEKTLPQVQAFLKEGGDVITMGSSNVLASMLSLPVLDALTETMNGKTAKLPGEKFYIPGAVLKAEINPENPVAYGMPREADVFFDNSPAFRLAPDAGIRGVQTVAWYGGGNLLESGWAWGQQYLENTVAAATVPMGKGSVLMLGPEVMFRGQPHGTFKLLFNGVMLSVATQ